MIILWLSVAQFYLSVKTKQKIAVYGCSFVAKVRNQGSTHHWLESSNNQSPATTTTTAGSLRIQTFNIIILAKGSGQGFLSVANDHRKNEAQDNCIRIKNIANFYARNGGGSQRFSSGNEHNYEILPKQL